MAINYTRVELNAMRRDNLLYSAMVEKRWIPKVRSAIRKQIAPVLPWLEKNGVQSTILSLQGLIHPGPIEAAIKSLYIIEGRKAGKREERALNAKYGAEFKQQVGGDITLKAFDFFDEWLRLMDKYYDDRGADQVVRITDTTRRQLQDKLIAGTQADYTFPEYRDLLIDYSVDIGRSRANVIARTEVISALNYAQDHAARSAPVEFNKGWLSAHDKRTRYRPRDKGDHVVMDGEEVPFELNFSNGGKWPGDPDLPAYERIQCRCSKYHDALRDKDGRLIVK